MKINVNELSDNISVFEDTAEYKPIKYKYIGIAFKTYIILEISQLISIKK